MTCVPYWRNGAGRKAARPSSRGATGSRKRMYLPSSRGPRRRLRGCARCWASPRTACDGAGNEEHQMRDVAQGIVDEALPHFKAYSPDHNERLVDAIARGLRDACNGRIAVLEAALREIEGKYQSAMRKPPGFVSMTERELKLIREAWYGASLIARRALSKTPAEV